LKKFDTIVIGAGHNGLVCANYLARRGQRVLIVERSNEIGGLAASREFHPGFKVSVAHSVGHFSPRIVRDLELQDHGLALGAVLPMIGLAAGGQSVRLDERGVAGVGDDDAGRYLALRGQLQKFAAALSPFWLKTIPRIAKGSLADMMTFAHLGLRLRGLGRDDMREFMRIATLPMRDLMDENFDSELLKAVLSWDGLLGSKLAPRSPNNAILTLLYRMADSDGHQVPAGGVPGLVQALCSAAAANGAEIRTGAAVERILVDGSADGLVATGVRLENGTSIAAKNVVSSADPKCTFVDLAGVANLEIQFTNRIRRLRCDGQVAKLHLALDALPDFAGLDRPDGRILLAPTMDTIEFAFDDAKYGACSEQPVVEVVLPSLYDESLAPAGQHVLSAHVMYVPHDLEGGWTDAARTTIRERTIDAIAAFAPGLRAHILHAEFLTPADLEEQYHVSGGHWHHGEMALDQMLMMRPTYEAAQYRTPIPGLFLCGAGCHPGGDITGGPGHNAAAEILR